jgi:chitodextrinase
MLRDNTEGHQSTFARSSPRKLARADGEDPEAEWGAKTADLGEVVERELEALVEAAWAQAGEAEACAGTVVEAQEAEDTAREDLEAERLEDPEKEAKLVAEEGEEAVHLEPARSLVLLQLALFCSPLDCRSEMEHLRPTGSCTPLVSCNP